MGQDHSHPREMDGTGECGGWQANSRAPRRGARAPRPHTRNRSERSDTPPARAARDRLGTRESPRSGCAARRRDQSCRPLELRLERRKRHGVRRRQRPDYDVHWRQTGNETRADHLTEPALETVSRHGVVRVARDDYADPRMRPRRAHRPDVQMRHPKARTLMSNGLQVIAPSEPVAARKRVRARAISADASPRAALRPSVLGRQPHSQPLAPLLAATTQDLTSPPGLHARTKAVRADAALVARAVCWFAHSPQTYASGEVGSRSQTTSITLSSVHKN